ncbi:MAG: HAMP domain-containing protein [bacterium]|nr:HAMP domain-containing protein [bacterium]
MRRRRSPNVSLEGRITAVFALALVVVAGLAAAASGLPLPPWILFLLILTAGLPLGIWILHRTLRPLGEILRALVDGVSSLRDRDFSMRLAVRGRDELGELVSAYNQAVDVLREERTALRQRELLLETALHRSPLAIVLTNQRDRVIFANPEARRLLIGGRRLEGQRFGTILAGCPAAMAETLAAGNDGLFSVEHQGTTETYHLSRRVFQVNRFRHTLYLLRRLTAELDREEVRIWKKVIRVISHELNNSLAPISSLVQSASIAFDKPAHQHRLHAIFASIEERVTHLKDFVDGYADFARLPAPRRERTTWAPFLASLQELYAFELHCPRDVEGFFDPAQIEQVVINLLKNAAEASPRDGDAPGSIEVRVDLTADGGTRLQVLDRGSGMDEEVLRSALLPFYSTKADGVGVGLPLCREIVANHGGTLRMQSRDGGGAAVICLLPSAKGSIPPADQAATQGRDHGSS